MTDSNNEETRRLGEWVEVYRRCRKGAKTRGIEWAFSVDDMMKLAAEAHGRCQVSMIRFSSEKAGYKKRPWLPSLDRIDPRGAYRPDNVRLVCAAVNLARNVWSDDVFFSLCDAVVKSARLRVGPKVIPGDLPQRMLNVTEVAKILGISPATLRNRLEARVNGNRWKLRRASLEDTPPMKKCGGRWMVYGPTLEQWIGGTQ